MIPVTPALDLVVTLAVDLASADGGREVSRHAGRHADRHASMHASRHASIQRNTEVLEPTQTTLPHKCIAVETRTANVP